MSSHPAANRNDWERLPPTPRAVVARAGNSIGHLIPAAILLYSALIPQQMRLVVAEQTLYPHRVAILVLIPWLFLALRNGRLHLKLFDLFVLLGAAWMVISFAFVHGLADGLRRGSIIMLDVLGTYLIARASVRHPDDIRRLLVILAPGVAVVGIFMMIESVSRTPIIAPLADAIFGPVGPAVSEGETADQSAERIRLGLMRAAGPFSHPILGGVLLCSLFPVYFYSGLRGWPRGSGLFASLTGIFSVSSAGFLALAAGVALVVYDIIQKLVTVLSWRLLIIFGTVSATAAHFASQNGLIFLFINYTLDPQTGYFRTLIWRYGMQSVTRNPLFGIGYGEYERPRWMPLTVDSYWLSMAIRHGLVTPIMYLCLFIGVIYLCSRRASQLTGPDRRLMVGLAICVFVLLICGFTVSFFGGVLIYVFAMMGIITTVATHTVPLAQMRDPRLG